MRQVTLTKTDFDMTYTQLGSRAVITSTDADTGELVTYELTDVDLLNELMIRATRDGSVSLTLADFQVINVEPVRGEWDSPGTSPEEDGA